MVSRRMSGVSNRALVFWGLIFGAVLLGVALPGLHEQITPRQGHYETPKRVQQAAQARTICENPRNPCKWYECDTTSGAMLRVCQGLVDGAPVNALQWVYLADNGKWSEGSGFIQSKQSKVDRYLSNNRCVEVTQ